MANTGTESVDRLKDVSRELLKTLGGRAAGFVSDSMGGLTDRLDKVAEGGPIKDAVAGALGSKAEGGNPAAGALKGALGGVKDKLTGGGKNGGSNGGGNSGGKPTKATVIIEQIDVGVPITVAYNQWTEFGSFPQFMKKVEKVHAQEDTKLEWKAQIVWSHRTWQATILDQVPDERIVWRSQGQKGHVDGAVTFHELGPNLTRIVLVLEYYPQGLFERTGNIWRAQGRRVRAELQHFRRHVMTRTILNPDDVEGWRGEIRDSEVVRSHEDALQDEAEDREDEPEDEDGDEDGDEPGDEDEYDESEDQSDDEDEVEPEDDDYQDEPDDEDEPDVEPEDDEVEDEPEDDDEAEDEPDDRRDAS